jgi:hypothetical protein
MLESTTQTANAEPEVLPELHLEHQNVPVEHRGLHDFLYGNGDDHTVADSATLTLDNMADRIVPLATWCEIVGTAKVAGVYAVWDGDLQLHYVNISRNVALSVKGHLNQLGPDICAFVRVQPFKFPQRQVMADLQAAWIAENGAVPPGNGDRADLWTETPLAAMSPAERAAYEEKKLKLRKAMADNTLSQPAAIAAPTTLSATEQRQNLAAAHSDDWSSVIHSQTQATLPE